MAQSRTAKKAIRQNVKRRAHNRALNAAMRTQIKKLRTAVDEGDKAAAASELPRAQKLIDKAAKTRRVHVKKAARMKSQLAKAVDGLGS